MTNKSKVNVQAHLIDQQPSGCNPDTLDQAETVEPWRRAVTDTTCLPPIFVFCSNAYLCVASDTRDVRFSDPPSGQGAGGETRTRDRRVFAGLRADLLATQPPKPRRLLKDFMELSRVSE
ncbi:hypothetical protein PoB_005930800 [Plakobranchus ocellatus]|uniref:Uncharacterized protein n=1 Tax=Plakobranchus ocellatus TaxID=259542 RepID=A0AAV4CMZ8_9GAST|nr:hypothetical protein PoB_005930800 [Plakobranchus ocellatus]